MNMNENITQDSEAVFRALRDTILDAPDGQMSELIADVGMDSKQLAQRARNAVTDARAEHQKHQDANNKVIGLHKCLGALIEMLRRRDGLDEDQLACKARVSAEEIRRIEYDTAFLPSPRTLFNLENVFALPSGSLGKLSGAITGQSDEFQDKALKFAANAKSMGRQL